MKTTPSRLRSRVIGFIAGPDLFFFSLFWLMFLVIAGTLAQRDIGLYQAQQKYFSSFILMFGPVPLPGASLVMAVIFLGLLAKLLFRSRWNRAMLGVNITHLGSILLLLGGFLTAVFSQEGNMAIQEGAELGYFADYHDVELAVIDTAPSDHDLVTVFEEGWLKQGSVMSHSSLPFRIEVLEMHRNVEVTSLRPLPLDKEDYRNRAGLLLRISGAGARSDGTYAVFEQMPVLQTIKTEKGEYVVDVRKARRRLPFAIRLIEFQKENYPATEMARNYRSVVEVKDGAVTQRSLIQMNEPLRYKGYTFYQSSFAEDGQMKTSVFSVVRNFGALFPYVSSLIMCIGLLIHLVSKLPALVSRKAAMLPLALLLFIGNERGFCAEARDSAFLGELSEIPVLHEGRIKPLDTFARTHLLAFSGKSSLPDAMALEWLAEALFLPEQSAARRVFEIRNPQVAAALALDPHTRRRYSFSELYPGMKKVSRTLMELHQSPEEGRTPEQRQLLDLYAKVMLFREIKDSLSMMRDSQSDIFRIIPAQWPPQWSPQRQNGIDWFSPSLLLSNGQGSPETSRYLAAWKSMALAYSTGSPQEKLAAAKVLREEARLITGHATSPRLLSLEVKYNAWNLFEASLGLYVLSFLLILASTMYGTGKLRNASFFTLLLALVLHVAGIGIRVVIMGRPPVATLYESVVFVGATVAIFSLIYERIMKNGVGLITGAPTAAALHLMALGYAADGDTMGMLAAVLNTNFWLACHVVTISIGYGCCIVAGVLGHIYLVKAITGKKRQTDLATLYSNMIGASLVALFFTLFGTILGGIWADQSWGRFWGWDPKENGALLIVLWLLMLLHGRLGGTLRPLGYASLLVLTNAIVAIAWFGVNLLNVGLHSYGFTESVALNLGLFVGAELFLSVAGYVMAGKIRRQ